jgi:hypothetical protein
LTGIPLSPLTSAEKFELKKKQYSDAVTAANNKQNDPTVSPVQYFTRYKNINVSKNGDLASKKTMISRYSSIATNQEKEKNNQVKYQESSGMYFIYVYVCVYV